VTRKGAVTLVVTMSEPLPRPDGDPADVADGPPAGGAEALRLLDVEAAPPGTYGEFEPDTAPLIDAEGRVRLSFSRIERYETCPRQFRYTYVDRLPGIPGPNLSFGSSIHNALRTNPPTTPRHQ
jgi:hypothetical protein